MRPEDGQERIADLKAMTSPVLRDSWETVEVRFLIYHPLKETEVMRIQGDTLQLGNWGCKIHGYDDKEGELHAKIMTISKEPFRWLTGELVHPWVYTVTYNVRDMQRKI